MEKIGIINTNNETITALFRTQDVAEVNLLRRAILSEIETYAIDIVIFQTNTSPRHDEIIALRLGQLVIDHSRFVPPEDNDYKVHIDVQGPGEFTTNDIPDLPFKYDTPITTLKRGQRIICDCIVKKGTGKMHVKWRPISTFSFTKADDGYLLNIKGIGMLPPEELIQKGINMISNAAHRRPTTLFSQPLIPSEF